MYRYIVDQAITYTSEDLILFKESPFACWMERLSLENPGHGIPPDAGSVVPSDTMEPQDSLADTLRAEGKDVVLVEWDSDEPLRRTGTLEAMRHGADFIVNGQLALGPLSGSANLLMRTSGYSELGNYLYVPCNTQHKTTLHSALRLCFLADLLHSLQGQLPPQMLIIRGGSDVVPLQTEDHIYHYRAVKQRFMAAQAAFRKHKMPDPAESSHFGRWEDCANEVLKQRALGREHSFQKEEVAKDDIALASACEQVQAGSAATAYDLDEVNRAPVSGQLAAGGTLAEQARMLGPVPTAVVKAEGRQADTLQNLAFIGSSSRAPTIGREEPRPAASENTAPENATPENATPENATPEKFVQESSRESDEEIAPKLTTATPTIDSETTGGEWIEDSPMQRVKAHPLDSAGFQSAAPAGVDLDANPPPVERVGTPAPSLCPVPEQTPERLVAAKIEDQPDAVKTHSDQGDLSDHHKVEIKPFNSSLITFVGAGVGESEG
jgi:hypothetical protein